MIPTFHYGDRVHVGRRAATVLGITDAGLVEVVFRGDDRIREIRPGKIRRCGCS